MTDFTFTKNARSGRTLVLAAHPDDEVLGCGGAILSHSGQGDPVFVVIVTDGGFPVHPDQQVPGYALLRNRESIEASNLLGCGAPRFLHLPDQGLKKMSNLSGIIADILNEYLPDNIYLPAFTEVHPDHIALCQAGTEALKKYDGDFTLFYYEIGAALDPNYYLDITGLADQKQKAIGCFVSQLKVQNLTVQIAGLNQYRSYYLPKEVLSAEAFYCVDKQQVQQVEGLMLKAGHACDPVKAANCLLDFPLISVIVRTIGRPQLPEALQSIAEQNYPNLEVILVDALGGLDMSSIKLPANLRLRIVSQQKPLSRPVAANAGLDAVSGEYFCFLDEDDLIDPGHISDLWKWLHFRDEPAAYCGITMIDQHNRELLVFNEPFSRERLKSENYIPIHAALFKKRVLEAGCRFDERIEVYEDWDFLQSVLQSGNLIHLDKVSGTYRNYRTSPINRNPESSWKSKRAVLDKWSVIYRNAILNNPLAAFFYGNRRNIIHKWPHYFEVCHSYFQRFINTECIVVEIGVSLGGSLRMWRSYFGERARIIGIDINPECKKFEKPGIEIFIGSQDDPEFLRRFVSQVPRIDILIDDGGHHMKEQITAFEVLFPHLANHGIYLCEDTHTSYMKEYGGGLNNPSSFIEFAKKLADHLHAWHIPDQALPASDYTRNIQSVNFFDSMVVVEKRTRVQPWSVVRGAGLLPGADAVTHEDVEIFRMKLKLLGAGLPDYMDVGDLMSHPGHLKDYLGGRYDGSVWPETGETMIGFQRLTQLEQCMKVVIAENIPGDFIETGVWRGGACIFMAYLLKINNITDRTVWLADSFMGLPEPDAEKYSQDVGSNLHTCPYLAVSEAVVQENFNKYELDGARVRFLRGWFKDTLPDAPVDKLAILRLDGDMYESTMDALNALYHKLSVGGYCIIDDYGAIPACATAVEDFRRNAGISGEMVRIDYTGIYWRKEIEVSKSSSDL